MSNHPPRIPPPPPPPRPPPRPPTTTDYGWDHLEDEEETKGQNEEEEMPALTIHGQGELEESQESTPPREFLLTVMFPPPCSPEPMPFSNKGDTSQSTIAQSRRMDTVHIQVYPQMNADILALCVSQAVAQASMNDRGFQATLVVSVLVTVCCRQLSFRMP